LYNRGTAQTTQFRAMGIISGIIRHPKDLPFVRQFWYGTYGLGRIKPTKKKQISAIAAVDVLLSHDAKVNKLMWAWHAVRRCVIK